MPKTAAGIVNERSPGLQYKFSDMIGQPHDPLFHVTVFFPVSNLTCETVLILIVLLSYE